MFPVSDPCAGKAGTLRKITRVWTREVRLTNHKEEHLRSLDATRWAHILCRGIVADYHTRCAEVFGGAASNRLDEEGRSPVPATYCWLLATAVVYSLSCYGW